MWPSGKVRIARRQSARPEPGLRTQPSETGSQKIQNEFYCDMVSGTRLPEIPIKHIL